MIPEDSEVSESELPELPSELSRDPMLKTPKKQIVESFMNHMGDTEQSPTTYDDGNVSIDENV
jgi:hypothetical protein